VIGRLFIGTAGGETAVVFWYMRNCRASTASSRICTMPQRINCSGTSFWKYQTVLKMSPTAHASSRIGL